MLRVGITGGIGAGKTTVCQLFEDLGVPVYYADQAAKRLMYRDKTLKGKIKDLLGAAAYHRNGRPNRPYIASRVFSDQGLLEQLNGLVHPAVGNDASQWYASLSAEQHPYGLYEAALLVENGSYRSFDQLISVTAPRAIRIARVQARDGSTKEEVEARLDNQLPQADKDKVADYVITNIDRDSLPQQVRTVHQALVALARSADQQS